MIGDERAKKISAALKGHAVSSETRAKIAASNTGKVQSEATKAKKRAASLGKRASPETRAKISARFRGRQLSDAHRAAMSAAVTGTRLTTECRAKISAALKGRPKSAAHRAKVSEGCRRARLDGRGGVPPSRRYTKLAQALHRQLSERGVDLEPEVRFGPFSVDLYDRVNRTAYEADGTYWHALNEAAHQGYHERRDNYLREVHGLRVVRFTDVEIYALTVGAAPAQ